PLLDDDPVGLELEVGPETAQRPLHEQLEGGLGALELEALVLQGLEPIEDPARVGRVTVEVDAELTGLPEDVRLAGQLRDEHAAMIADRLGVDVLVGLGML